MSSQELHSGGAEQGDRRERMAVLAAGSEPRFHKLEECKESTAGELGQVRRELEQVKRKLEQLEKEVEGYEGREAKKSKADEEMEDSTYGCLGLRFTDPVPDRIYTMVKIEAENTKDLRVELIDTRTGKVVTSGPESSMKVQLDVVHGQFKGAETGNFSLKCFEHNILTRKRDNGPLLLLGDNFLDLNEGTAVVRNLKITANSSWIPSGRFRLAARVTAGDFEGMRVKEAITNAFVVKENRTKLAEKRDIPRPDDPVWRLKGIAKGGEINRRLTKKGIETVGDFLKSLNKNEDGLRDITRMRANAWKDTVEHARTCSLSGGRIRRPLSNHQVNHVHDVAQPKKVGKQQSPQVFGGSPSKLIDSIPSGSSKPEIQQHPIPSQAFAGSSGMGGKNVNVSRAPGDDALGNFSSGGTRNHEINSHPIHANEFAKKDGFVFDENDINFEEQQSHQVFGCSPSELIDSIPGGPSNPEIQQQHIPSQAFAGSSDMGGKNVDVSRASGDDAFGNFNSGGTWNHEVNSQPIHANEFAKKDGFGFDENDINFEDLYNQMTMNSTDTQVRMTALRQEAYNASSTGVFFNISGESAGERKHAWWTAEFR